RYILGAQTETERLVRFPFETDRVQPIDQVQTAGERTKVGLITQTGRTLRDLSGVVTTQLCVAPDADTRELDVAAHLELCARIVLADADVAIFFYDKAAADHTICVDLDDTGDDHRQDCAACPQRSDSKALIVLRHYFQLLTRTNRQAYSAALT